MSNRGMNKEVQILRVLIYTAVLINIITATIIRPTTSLILDLSKSDKINKITILNRFWTSSGLSPPTDEAEKYLLSKDMEINLAMMGALPHSGIAHVRIHWLLNLVSESFNKTIPPTYNFTKLDSLFSLLQRNGLSPGLELMGSPANLKEGSFNIPEWKRFLDILVVRYIAMFGEKYVTTWRFETLNEPDLRQYNLWNFTLPDYISYVEASASIINKYNFLLWGPAGLFKDGKQHTRCWGLLDVCNGASCPVSVISFHKKGDARASQVVNGSEALLEQIRTYYPGVPQLLVANNEADPLTGWWREAKWRADVRYAAAVVQTVIGFVNLEGRRDIQLAAVSNDNGFLSYSPPYWTQRTLFARMQANSAKPSHMQLMKKPVYSAMALLSLMGNETLNISYQPGEPGLSILATSEGDRTAVILTLVNDILDAKTSHKKVSIHLKFNLAPGTAERRGVIYLLDNMVTNPARTWRKAGSLSFPNKTLRRQIRQQGEPHEMRHISLDRSHNIQDFDINLALRVPSVVVFNLCSCNRSPLGPVNSLHYLNITDNEILLIWKDEHVGSRCLLTYTVEFRPHGEADFKIISPYHSFANSFYFDGCIPSMTDIGKCEEVEDVEGEYQITAIDYCNEKGQPVSIRVY